MSDYDSGRENRQFEGHMDLAEYKRGERDRKEAEAAWMPQPQKVEVSGVAYTILLMAPFLYLVYPVLGFTILAVLVGAVLLFSYTPLPLALEIVIGLVVCVMSFFLGYKLEAKVSQYRVYRLLRGAFRAVNFVVVPVILLSVDQISSLDNLELNSASGATLIVGIVIAVLGHFIFRTLDRLYFPVWADVEKMAEQAAKGIPFRRGLIKRIVYSLIWLIPSMMVFNFIIRLIVNAVSEGPLDVMDFYDQYSVVVYAVDLVAWLLLCVFGILPGTARHRKSYIDHETLLKQSGRS